MPAFVPRGLNPHLCDNQDGTCADERLAGDTKGNGRALGTIQHLIFSREIVQWAFEGNVPPWCHEESVNKVWELLGKWNGTSHWSCPQCRREPPTSGSSHPLHHIDQAPRVPRSPAWALFHTLTPQQHSQLLPSRAGGPRKAAACHAVWAVPHCCCSELRR